MQTRTCRCTIDLCSMTREKVQSVAQLKRTQSEMWQDGAGQEAQPHRRLPRAALASRGSERCVHICWPQATLRQTVTCGKASARRSEPAVQQQLDQLRRKASAPMAALAYSAGRLHTWTVGGKRLHFLLQARVALQVPSSAQSKRTHKRIIGQDERSKRAIQQQAAAEQTSTHRTRRSFGRAAQSNCALISRRCQTRTEYHSYMHQFKLERAGSRFQERQSKSGRLTVVSRK